MRIYQVVMYDLYLHVYDLQHPLKKPLRPKWPPNGFNNCCSDQFGKNWRLRKFRNLTRGAPSESKQSIWIPKTAYSLLDSLLTMHFQWTLLGMLKTSKFRSIMPANFIENTRIDQYMMETGQRWDRLPVNLIVTMPSLHVATQKRRSGLDLFILIWRLPWSNHLLITHTAGAPTFYLHMVTLHK